MSDEKNNDVNNKKNQAPGILSVFQSVIAAMFGVQSDEKREQDFEHGSAINYIVVGVIMVIAFILILVSIVNAILAE